MMKWLKYPLMNDEPGAGGGAPATPPPASTGSVLNGGAPQTNPYDYMPEKFRVFGEDKSWNESASAQKMAEAYGNLEKQFGNREAAPETMEGYKLDAESMGEGFNAEEFMKDPKTQGFLKRMHAKGLNNTQLQEVIDYGLNEWAPDMMNGAKALSESECTAALKEVWKTDTEYETAVQQAFKAVHQIGGDKFQSLIEKYGNDPDFIQFAASIGKEIREDQSPSDPLPLKGGETIESMMMSDAYRNPSHPEHAAVSKRVKAYFESRHGKAKVA